MNQSSLLRIVPWIVLIVVAFATGRWQAGSRHAETKASAPTAAAPRAPVAADATTPTVAPTPPLDRAARVVAEVEVVANAAKTMANPDSRTYAFFEHLELADIAPVVGYIEKMPAGNEQDLLFALAMRRWAELDGPAAVVRAGEFPALSTRVSSQLAAFEAWGAHDAATAFTEAAKEKQETARARKLAAVLSGAGTFDPRAALALWQTAPDSFRTSAAGLASAGQIVSAACGTGKRELAQALIAEQTPGGMRTQMIDTLAREWAGHAPDRAFAWVQTVLPAGEERDGVVNNLFTSLARKDPAMAAAWAAAFPDERRQMGFIAAAISEWAPLDSDAAEEWVNEQPTGRMLDGASYAIAAHFLTQHDMPRSFGWIRRINQPEARSEMLGNLGLVWSRERPAEFKKFLDETSLNPAEVRMLFAKIGPAP